MKDTMKMNKNNLNLYEIDFVPEYPVPSGLLILASSMEDAIVMARVELEGLEIVSVTLIEMDKPKVVFYESGDY